MKKSYKSVEEVISTLIKLDKASNKAECYHMNQTKYVDKEGHVFDFYDFAVEYGTKSYTNEMGVSGIIQLNFETSYDKRTGYVLTHMVVRAGRYITKAQKDKIDEYMNCYVDFNTYGNKKPQYQIEFNSFGRRMDYNKLRYVA